MRFNVKFTAAFALTGLTIAGIAGCGASGASGKNVSNTSNKSATSSNKSAKTTGGSSKTENITFAWWTDSTLTKETTQVVKLFEQKHPNIHVTMEYYPWSGYWSKLATEIAGGSEPDVMQMDASYLNEYVNKNRLADLSKLGVDTSNLSPLAVKLGTVDGKMYALTTAFNSIIVVYNPAVSKKAGIPYPKEGYTWSDFAKWCIQVHQKTGVYGTESQAGWLPLLQVYALSKGDKLWSSDGKSLAVSKQTLTDWFNYWLNLQEKGGVPSAAMSASYNHSKVSSNPFVSGKAASVLVWLGQGGQFQTALNKPVGREMLPGANNSNNPLLVKPAMYWSVSSQSKYPKAAAKLVNFLENNPQAAKIMKNSRGVTPNKSNLKLLESSGDKTSQSQDKIMAQIEKVGSPMPIPPSADAKVTSMLKTIGQEVLYKKMTASQGASKFLAEANNYMKNN